MLNEGYDTGTTDFAPIINKIPADADAVMGGGHFADGQQFAKAMFDKDIPAKLIACWSLHRNRPLPKLATQPSGSSVPASGNLWPPLHRITDRPARIL